MTCYKLLFLCFCGQGLYGQSKSFTLRLFYDLNEIKNTRAFQRVDSAMQVLAGDSCTVKITGYADYLGSQAYNVTLSQQRAAGIRAYIREKPVAYKLRITACEGLGETDSKDNGSKLGMPYSRRVDVHVHVDVYAPVMQAKASPSPKTEAPAAGTQSQAPARQQFEQLKKGESMAINNLSFFPGRHIWTQASETALTSLLLTLQMFPEMKIEIQGHICCIYNDGDALDFDNNEKRLSENRARAVYDYLVGEGIDAGRLRYKGYGHSRPKVKAEKTAGDEQANRRVEIKILEN